MIGDDRNINIFGDLWTTNRVVINEADTQHFSPFLPVADLFVAGRKVWNGEMIDHLFPTTTVNQIF